MNQSLSQLWFIWLIAYKTDYLNELHFLVMSVILLLLWESMIYVCLSHCLLAVRWSLYSSVPLVCSTCWSFFLNETSSPLSFEYHFYLFYFSIQSYKLICYLESKMKRIPLDSAISFIELPAFLASASCRKVFFSFSFFFFGEQLCRI